MTYLHDPARGSGRTLGLMIKTLGDACMEPGKQKEFIDHSPFYKRMPNVYKDSIEEMAKLLSLSVKVDIIKDRIFVTSLHQVGKHA